MCLAFIKFTKASDLVNHDIVREALDLGVGKSLVTWINNFLADHPQAITFYRNTSAFLPFTCEVPSFTKRGSLCFLINDVLKDTDTR